jgi:hypothetical protein
LPKKGARKGHPGCPGPSGFLVLLAVDGTLKTRLRLRQVQRLVPSTSAMLSGTEWGKKNRIKASKENKRIKNNTNLSYFVIYLYSLSSSCP